MQRAEGRHKEGSPTSAVPRYNLGGGRQTAGASCLEFAAAHVKVVEGRGEQ